MKILILHRIPYQKIDYHRGIDHVLHDVTYFGKKDALATLPRALRCAAVERLGKASAYDEAREWLAARPQRFDLVISLSEYELLDAAYLREWLGVSGASVAQVSLARDKMLMKEAAARASLRAPRFTSLAAFMESGGRVPWNGATVIKPNSGASSEDVVVFPSPLDAFVAIKAKRSGATQLDRASEATTLFEVEEFISGPILHFDGLLDQGHVVAMTASEYIGNCLRYANGEPLGSCHYPLDATERQWAERALRATGIANGSFHLEAIRHGTELVFLEVANRVGGADVVRTFELATGVHLPSEELRILTGESSRPATPVQVGRWHGWFVFPGHQLASTAHPGFEGVDVFRASESIVHWHELEAGALLPRHVTYQAHEVPLAGVVATDSARATRTWVESLFGAVAYRSPHVARALAEHS